MTTIDHVTTFTLARLLRGYPAYNVDLSVVPDYWQSLVGCVATANGNGRMLEFESALKNMPSGEADALINAVFDSDPDGEPAAQASDESDGWPVLTLPELLALQDESIDWLLTDLIPAGGLAILAGPPACGKTFLSLDLALGVATGGQTWGRAPLAGNVLYVDAENAPRLLAHRMRGLLAGRGLSPIDSLYFLPGQMMALTEPDDLAQLGAAIASKGARLVIFDSLIRFLGGADENDASAIASAMGGLRSLANAHDCAVLLLHHLRKSGGQTVGTALEAVRGSGDLVAAVDSVFIVRGTNGVGNVMPAKSRWIESPPPFGFAIVSDDDGTVITIGEPTEAGKPKIERVTETILSILADSKTTLTKKNIVSLLETEGVETSDRTIVTALTTLRDGGRVNVAKDGRANTYELPQASE